MDEIKSLISVSGMSDLVTIFADEDSVTIFPLASNFDEAMEINARMGRIMVKARFRPLPSGYSLQTRWAI